MRTAVALPLLAAMLAVLVVLVPMLTTAMEVPVMVGDQQLTLRLPDDADQVTLEQGIAEMSAAFQKVRVRIGSFKSSTTDPPASVSGVPFAGWTPLCIAGSRGQCEAWARAQIKLGGDLGQVGRCEAAQQAQAVEAARSHPIRQRCGLSAERTQQYACWCIGTPALIGSRTVHPYAFPSPLFTESPAQERADHEGCVSLSSGSMQRTDECACG
jgi:hypothetical protein